MQRAGKNPFSINLYLNKFNLYGNLDIDLNLDNNILKADAIIATDTIDISSNSYLNIKSDLLFENLTS